MDINDIIDREMFHGASPSLFEKAYELRKNMTEAERKLWLYLNKGQLGVRFKAQHPIDIYIADFYCHPLKLVIELDGKIHLEQWEKDYSRTEELKNSSIKVLRFKNEQVLNNVEEVLDKIKSTIRELQKSI